MKEHLKLLGGLLIRLILTASFGLIFGAFAAWLGKQLQLDETLVLLIIVASIGVIWIRVREW